MDASSRLLIVVVATRVYSGLLKSFTVAVLVTTVALLRPELLSVAVMTILSFSLAASTLS